MSVYVDGWHDQHSRATITIEDKRREAMVTYRNATGQSFRVMVVQRANPIGFHAVLPGDRKRTKSTG